MVTMYQQREEGFSENLEERMDYTMNISGVTHTAQVLPPPPAEAANAASAEAAVPAGEVAAVGADAVAFEAQVATQVMDMAQSQFEDAANQLISQMAATTGVGQNVDAFA